MRRHVGRVGILAAILVSFAILGSIQATRATYSPSGVIKLCAYSLDLNTPCSSETLTAGSQADMTFDMSLPTGNLNSSMQATLLPGTATMPGPESNLACTDSVDSDGDGSVNDGCPPKAPDPESACSDSTDSDADGLVNDGCPTVGAPALGAVIGRAKLGVTAGFLNNPCSTSLSTTIYLFNSSTDNEFTIATRVPGAVTGEGPFEEFRDDLDANGLPQHVEMYPSFLNKLLDPDLVGDINGDGDWYDTVSGVAENPGASAIDEFGANEPVRVLARYSGTALISGQALLFQVLTFSPGSLAPFSRPHPLSDFYSSSVGYPALTILNDPTQISAPDAVTSLCSPGSATVMLWGKTRDNPCLGGTCPNDDTPCYISCGNNDAINDFTGSTPAFANDPTIRAGCTSQNTAGCTRWSNPSSAGTKLFLIYDQSQRDTDGDGIENSLDTCPTTATSGYNPRSSDATNDPDGDGIPKTSGGADGCDTDGDWFKFGDEAWIYYSEWEQCLAADNEDELDGVINDGCPTHMGSAESACTGSADDDFDGRVNDGCPQVGSRHEASCLDFDDDDADSRVNDGCVIRSGAAETQCTDSLDNDFDGYPNDGCLPVLPSGGNAHLDPCGGASSPPYNSPAGWPLDMNGNGLVNGADQLSFNPRFGTASGYPLYDQRWDIRPNNLINGADILAFNISPPMLNGQPTIVSFCPYP